MADPTKDGGPAFPVSTQVSLNSDHGNYGHQDGPRTWQFGGMSLRDHFAAKAMAALLSTITEYPDEHWRVGVALDAYAMADAMLRARENGNG